MNRTACGQALYCLVTVLGVTEVRQRILVGALLLILAGGFMGWRFFSKGRQDDSSKASLKTDGVKITSRSGELPEGIEIKTGIDALTSVADRNVKSAMLVLERALSIIEKSENRAVACSEFEEKLTRFSPLLAMANQNVKPLQIRFDTACVQTDVNRH